VRRICIVIAGTADLICRVLFFWLCDRVTKIVQVICDAMQRFTRQVCDVATTISRVVCDASRTVSQTICDATSWIPIIGDLICIASHVVSTVICVVSHVVSETVCLASHVISWLVCVASHVVELVVCIGWRLVTAVICIIVITLARIICIFTCGFGYLFAANEFFALRAECIYGWTSRYRIEERANCELHVTLRIRLAPDPGVSAADIAACQARWKPAIEQAWSNRFPVSLRSGDCGCKVQTVRVEVLWVSSGEHHVVRVRAGSGRADMTDWFVNSTGGTAAHEAGHMFGNVDEYSDPQCLARTVTSDGSIMQNSQTGTVKERHYAGFADWKSKRTCCTYAVTGGG